MFPTGSLTRKTILYDWDLAPRCFEFSALLVTGIGPELIWRVLLVRTAGEKSCTRVQEIEVKPFAHVCKAVL